MNCEIEFLPVGEGAKSGDAIVLRYWDADLNDWRVMVVDGGYAATGKAICDHIRRYYETEIIDHLVSTHPDNDHMSGLRTVMEEMDVRQLWMNVPEAHAADILPLFKSRRWQVENLRRELRKSYDYVTTLLQLAEAQGTTIYLPFQGQQIGPFTVLSPSREMYEGLLPQFRDTPPPDIELLTQLGTWLRGIGRRVAQATRMVIPEDWATETLKDGGVTSAENESSVVLYGRLGHGGVFLTADAGLRALYEASRFADESGIDISDGLWIFQVPHHGSRNNISPSALNYFLGGPVSPGASRRTQCVVSAGVSDPTHPRKVVVNALLRRGCSVTTTKQTALRFWYGLPQRPGLTSVQSLTFSDHVEAYD
ncbi:ComEC/Rec2 family competence protein [Nisaea denitrificans]|uniref:ComEC/Rec2 family competence protein n=1 Tax=Nisaea denitrificans TaxID=390877 RepID=UPI00041D0D09|nr:hypothetical protein [Nisaea denitrificans]